jgi:hypothetical protein
MLGGLAVHPVRIKSALGYVVPIEEPGRPPVRKANPRPIGASGYKGQAHAAKSRVEID